MSIVEELTDDFLRLQEVPLLSCEEALRWAISGDTDFARLAPELARHLKDAQEFAQELFSHSPALAPAEEALLHQHDEVVAVRLLSVCLPLRAPLSKRLRTRDAEVLSPLRLLLKLLLTAVAKCPRMKEGIVYTDASRCDLPFHLGERSLSEGAIQTCWAFHEVTCDRRMLDVEKPLSASPITLLAIDACAVFDLSRFAGPKRGPPPSPPLLLLLAPGTRLKVKHDLELEPGVRNVALVQQPFGLWPGVNVRATYLEQLHPATLQHQTLQERTLEELEMIAVEITKSLKYAYSKCGLMPLPGFNPALAYHHGARILEQLIDKPHLKALGMFGLARCVEDHEMVTLSDGRSMTARQVCMEALQWDPDFAPAYNYIGATFQKTDKSVTLRDGRSLTELELYVEALRCNPKLCTGYHNLSILLSRGDSVTLCDGRKMGKLELLIEALRCDPNYVPAYASLSCELSGSETVTLSDARVMDERQLFMEALRLDPTTSTVYVNLARLLSPNECVVLGGGWCMGHRQLCLEALRWNPEYDRAYANLGAHVGGGAVTLPDGRTLKALHLFVEALRCNPDYALAYACTAENIPASGSVRLADGRVMNRSTLFIEAIRCAPEDMSFFLALAETLRPGESVTLTDGRTFTKEALQAMASA
jgi:tetratricopeptide (TPR) repeat protein